VRWGPHRDAGPGGARPADRRAAAHRTGLACRRPSWRPEGVGRRRPTQHPGAPHGRRDTSASPAAAAALALAACGGNRDAGATAVDTAAYRARTAMSGDAGATAPGAAAGTNASLADANTSAQIDSVAAAGRGRLTALAPSVAVRLIRSLEDKLDNSNDPALTDIAEDLEKLREELDDEAGVNGADVANILERLGPKVSDAAAKAGPAAATLRTIGQQLTSAATQLRGGGS
jgi:hypothetical protein